METWKAVPGYEHRFIVSDQGRVARVMAAPPPGKYHRIAAEGAGSKQLLGHVMVLEAFVGPRPEGAVARHLNDDKRDNRLVNLQWGSAKENFDDSVRNGGRKLKTHCPLGHPITGPNAQPTSSTPRCKACNRARANAHWHSRPFLKEDADRYFEEVMG